MSPKSKRDLSIKIKTPQGRIITWTPRDPLPPESRFLPLPAEVASSKTQKQRVILRRLRMFLKRKEKKRKVQRSTKAVFTGHGSHTSDDDHYEPGNEAKSESKAHTVMHRFKNLWTRNAKSKTGGSPYMERQDQGRGRGRGTGRQPSWTLACRGCHDPLNSGIPHNPAVCRLHRRESTGDLISPSSSPPSSSSERRGAISQPHNLPEGLATQRFHLANQKVEGLMADSVARSPAMIPLFTDDIRKCMSSENQQDGNIGVPREGVRGIRMASRGSVVEVWVDDLFQVDSYLDGGSEVSSHGDMEVSDEEEGEGEVFRMEEVETRKRGIRPYGSSPHQLTRKEFVSSLSKRFKEPGKGGRGQSMATTSVNLSDLAPHEQIPEFYLPPPLSPVRSRPSSSSKSHSVTLDIEEAMNANLISSEPAPMPIPRKQRLLRKSSSVYSSDLPAYLAESMNPYAPLHSNPVSNPTASVYSSDLPAFLEEARINHLGQRPLPKKIRTSSTVHSSDLPRYRNSLGSRNGPIARPSSSIYSSPDSSISFIPPLVDPNEENKDRVQEYLSGDLPTLPELQAMGKGEDSDGDDMKNGDRVVKADDVEVSKNQTFSIDRGMEGDLQTRMTNLSLLKKSEFIPPLGLRKISFSIDRGYLGPSRPRPLSLPSEFTTDNEVNGKPDTDVDNNDERESSSGSEVLNISDPSSPQEEQLASSSGFEMLSSTETIPPVPIRKKRSSGVAMPGRYPSEASSLSSMKDKREV